MTVKKYNVRVTEEFLAELECFRFFSRLEKTDPQWLKIGSTVAVKGNIVLEPYSSIRIGPRFFSIGSFSYSRSSFPGQVSIGRYSCIGANVKIMGVNHPMDRLSMSGLDYSSRAHFRAAREDFGRGPSLVKRGPKFKFNPPSFGDDVWVGDDVMIAQGVHIGTGSVVAARSVVTRDVEPYCIVAGVPATVKKSRFDDSVVDRLLASGWWKYNFVDFEGLPTDRPEEFLVQFEKLVETGQLTSWCPKPIVLFDLAYKIGAVYG